MEGVATPPAHASTEPPRSIAGAICIAIEVVMVLANILPILVSGSGWIPHYYGIRTLACAWTGSWAG